MISQLRNSGTLLTLVTLGIFGSSLVVILVLLFASSGPTAPPQAQGPPSGFADLLAMAAAIVLFTSLGWWMIAWMGGSLWRMNEDLMWRLMLCTGALGLIAAAVAHDLIVLHVVRHFYLGEHALTTRILRSP